MSATHPLRRLRVALLAAALVSCTEITIEDRPLDVTLEADRTSAAVGETIEFRYQAQGDALQGVVLAFGDGVADTLVAQGARTASRRPTHAYDEAGSYTARATVIELAGATRSAELTVQIGPAAGGS